MEEYHKIQTVYKRDPANRMKTLLEGKFSLPEFEYLANNTWLFTEKVDGTNIRVMFTPDDVSARIKFGGKTDNAQLPALLVEALQVMFLGQIDTFCEEFPDGVCLYGEGYGPRINGGGKYRDDHSFVLFDVKIGRWWLNRVDVEDIARKLGVRIVPIIGRSTLYDMVEMTRKGFGSRWGNFYAEGIVARPTVELFTRAGHRIITKVKYKDFPRQ